MADRLRSLRIALGALCAIDLVAWICDARPWLTDDGIVDRSSLPSVAAWPWRWSVLTAVGSSAAVRVVLAVGVLAAVVMAIGRAPRAAALVVAVVVTSVGARAPFALSGADMALQVLAVWWLVLVVSDPWPVAQRLALFAARLQLAAIYVVPLLRRATGGSATWLHGDALQRVLALDSLTRPFPGDFLERAPGALLRIGTWLVVLVEVAIVAVVVSVAVAGLLRRARPWGDRWVRPVLWCGVLLHVSMAAVLRLGLFPLVLPVAYLLLLPSADGGRTRVVGASGLGSRAVGVAASVVVLVLCTSVVAESAAQVVSPAADPTRHRWSTVLAATGLWQRWELFAPDPATTDRWITVETRASGAGWSPPGGSGPDRSAGLPALRRRKLGDNARTDPNLAGQWSDEICRAAGPTADVRAVRLVLHHGDGTMRVLARSTCAERTGAGRAP